MKALAVAAKDLLQSFRSRFALGMMLAAPLLLTGLLYFAFGGARRDAPAMKVGVADLDLQPPGSPLAASIGSSIRGIFFDESVRSWIDARDFASEAAARAAVESRAVGSALIVPPTFTKEYLAGKVEAPVILLSDPTLSIGPGIARAMLSSLLDGFSGGGIALGTTIERRAANGLTPYPKDVPAFAADYGDWYAGFQRDLFNDPGRAALAVVPSGIQGGKPSKGSDGDLMRRILSLIMASQLVFFAFYTGAYSMISVVREEEQGTLSRLFATPTARTAILASKYLAALGTVLVQALVLVGVGALAFGIDWGRPASAALAAAGQAAAATGLGVLLISLVRTTRQAGFVLGGALTALGMLGGLFTVAVRMPPGFELVNLLTPQGQAFASWRLAMGGASPAGLLPSFLAATGMGALAFGIGAARFGRRLG
jgi:ABC-2 type transport system permease protein